MSDFFSTEGDAGYSNDVTSDTYETETTSPTEEGSEAYAASGEETTGEVTDTQANQSYNSPNEYVYEVTKILADDKSLFNYAQETLLQSDNEYRLAYDLVQSDVKLDQFLAANMPKYTEQSMEDRKTIINHVKEEVIQGMINKASEATAGLKHQLLGSLEFHKSAAALENLSKEDADFAASYNRLGDSLYNAVISHHKLDANKLGENARVDFNKVMNSILYSAAENFRIPPEIFARALTSAVNHGNLAEAVNNISRNSYAKVKSVNGRGVNTSSANASTSSGISFFPTTY